MFLAKWDLLTRLAFSAYGPPCSRLRSEKRIFNAKGYSVCSMNAPKPTVDLSYKTGVSTAVFRSGPSSTANWSVLLVKRGKEPFRGCWSFPGGRLQEGEKIIEGAKRELREETGVDVDVVGPALVQFAPGGWQIHVCTAICSREQSVVAADDADAAKFFEVVQIDGVETTPGLSDAVYKAAAYLQIKPLPG